MNDYNTLCENNLQVKMLLAAAVISALFAAAGGSPIFGKGKHSSICVP